MGSDSYDPIMELELQCRNIIFMLYIRYVGVFSERYIIDGIIP